MWKDTKITIINHHHSIYCSVFSVISLIGKYISDISGGNNNNNDHFNFVKRKKGFSGKKQNPKVHTSKVYII